jgi:hypothetical protein
MSIRLRRPITALASVLSLTAAGAVIAAPAQSVPTPADAQCPSTYPVGDLTKGQSIDGLTVSSGTTPDPFTGTVLGTITDGIAPGLDMIVVRLTSPEIDRVGGIWQGMSGSPVYAADGRLIGAVSYGLAYGSSPVAGVTPADDMKALLGTPSSAQAKPASRVGLPATLRSRVASGAATTDREASSGLQRLAIPVGVSGLGSARLRKMAGRFDLDHVRLYRSAPAASAPATGGAAEIFAGGNLAASLSYGDLSAVGTGTTTMVCDGNVVAFGHQFGFAGHTSLTMHGADAVYVQEDPLGAPFKVANPTGPVGVIDEDRMAGIKGELGAAPASTLVRTSVTGPNGRNRTGETRVTVPEFASTATALGFLANLDRVFDHIGKGAADVHFTISGRTASGARFRLARSNRYADTADATFASIVEPAGDVDALLDNDFTGVTLDDIRIDAKLYDQVRSFHVARVQVRRNGVWRTVSPSTTVRVRHGRRVFLRVVLASRRNELGSRVITADLRVPRSAPRGVTGMVQVGSDVDGEFMDESGESSTGTTARSFGQLVQQLQTAPRNDELPVSLQLFTDEEGAPVAQTRKQAGVVVTGSTQFMLRVR